LGNRPTGNGNRTGAGNGNGSGHGSGDGGELNKENGEGNERCQATGNAPRLPHARRGGAENAVFAEWITLRHSRELVHESSQIEEASRIGARHGCALCVFRASALISQTA
jgi:hypothetical protein